MTDEERAREIAERHGGSVQSQAKLFFNLGHVFAAIRSHEREECAKAADAAHIRVLMKSDKLAKGYNTAALDIAAGIRARGGKT